MMLKLQPKITKNCRRNMMKIKEILLKKIKKLKNWFQKQPVLMKKFNS